MHRYRVALLGVSTWKSEVSNQRAKWPDLYERKEIVKAGCDSAWFTLGAAN